MFIALLRFSEYLITAFVSLNNELSMGSPTSIDQNPVELSYHSFMTSMDKSTGRCNVAGDLSTKVCFPSKKRRKC